MADQIPTNLSREGDHDKAVTDAHPKADSAPIQAGKPLKTGKMVITIDQPPKSQILITTPGYVCPELCASKPPQPYKSISNIDPSTTYKYVADIRRGEMSIEDLRKMQISKVLQKPTITPQSPTPETSYQQKFRTQRLENIPTIDKIRFQSRWNNLKRHTGVGYYKGPFVIRHWETEVRFMRLEYKPKEHEHKMKRQ
ncbi:hypothetical protein OCU04_000225 [Sclerotinia nivalis]|uniref:Uncharacterized protein n=1 Tax=Sclerotinia nivalis TaxID=352851 RepID=A0A9X0DPI7_9HELO|nr:hypothetical protein OCU04_000225 [Sclerotinia nivalis]